MLRSRMGNGAQIGFQLLFGHADAGIGKGECVCFIITVNGDFQGHMRVELDFFDQALMPEFLQGISGVGNQLAHKDVAFGVE